MTVPCLRPSVIFQQLYHVLLASVIAVIFILTGFTLHKLLSANQTFKYVDCFKIKHSNMLIVLSYKKVSMMSTVHNQCSVIVIPINEINFSVCLPAESMLALPRDLF